MKRLDLHEPRDFFEYVRVEGPAPTARRDRIDVAVLDMNHAWPNLGHDSIVHAILGAAEAFRERLVAAGTKVRALSYEVRRSGAIPPPPDGEPSLYIGSGGPGHLDPRLNDGRAPWSQGVSEWPGWEAPLFRLFDAIVQHRDAALFGICHSFGLLCRWSGAARPVLRGVKSSGVQQNVLSDSAARHPWFSRFAAELPDRRHYRVIDSRLFDLIVDGGPRSDCLAFDEEQSRTLTMIELARTSDGTMPRVFGMNHHPEVIDRRHMLEVLDEKRARGEVTEEWYRERADTMRELLAGDHGRESRLTSEYTFLGPLRHVLGLMITART